MRKADIIPAIGKGWRWTANIFFLRIVFAFDKVVRVSEDTVVDKIDY